MAQEDTRQHIGDLKSIVFLLRRFFKPYIKLILLLAVMNSITGVLKGIQPLAIAPAVNFMLGPEQKAATSLHELSLNNLGPTLLQWCGVNPFDFFQVIVAVIILYVAITLLMAGMGTCAFVLSAWVRSHVLKDMTVTLHRHMLSLPLRYFIQRRSGDLISRFTNDMTATVNSLDGVVRIMLQSVLQMLISMIMLFKTDWLLSICIVVISSTHFLITRLLGDLVKRRTQAVYDFLARMTAVLQETFQGMRTIKSFAAEEYDGLRMERAAEQVRRNLFRFRVARYAEEPVRLVADALAIAGMLFVAYFALTRGRLTMPGFALFVYLSRQAVLPISELSKTFLGMFSVSGGARRVIDIFHTTSGLVDGSVQSSSLQETIELKDITFSYQPDEPVLRNVSLRIERGETVAVVGPSGAGKSTLLDLILRLYDPDQGAVFYDGVDVRTFNRRSYLSRFGVVAQECILMNDTLRENISYGRPVEKDMVEHALQAAHATEFVSTMPAGLDTEVGDRGVRLSGGQRQRIGIARAVYGSPEILILDEATSALDSESEQAVQEAITQLVQNMTAVIVAHRLSTVMSADKVVVMQEGRIEAIGTHQELLSSSATYKKLYELQFGREVERAV